MSVGPRSPSSPPRRSSPARGRGCRGSASGGHTRRRRCRRCRTGSRGRRPLEVTPSEPRIRANATARRPRERIRRCPMPLRRSCGNRQPLRSTTRVGRYMSWLEVERGLHFDGYDDLWTWWTDDLAGFWSSLWDHFTVEGLPPTSVLSEPAHARCPLVRRRHALLPGPCPAHRAGAEVAVMARSQTRPAQDLTWGELRDQVARARTGLLRLGVQQGDRVAAYLPNIPETVVAFLATASIGAVWSSCAPEFGTRSVVDRFAQIEPTVLLVVDGYRYGAKAVDRTAKVGEIRAGFPASTTTVVVPYLDARHRPSARCLRVGRAARRARPARLRGGARSTTRSTSSSPRAPRVCPRPSCTATAASCSSTSRSSPSTTTSARGTASAGTRPPAG